jgi:hypothetical protein
MEWVKNVVGSMSQETVFFIVLIFIFFVFLNLSFNRRAITQGPTLLTTFGIFGTFVGIAIGLSEFDTTNVRDGVPALLSGLKTAFWASVFGVGGALCLKLRVFVFGTAEDDDQERHAEASVADVVRALQDVNISLAGRHETSLLTQLKMLRQTTNASHAALLKALGEIDVEKSEVKPQPVGAQPDETFAAMKAAFDDPSVRFGKRSESFTAVTTVNNDNAPVTTQ